MKPDKQLFYQKLGSLFFAIADADNKVRKEEEQVLAEQINDIWVPGEHSTDEFGTDLANYIFIAFDYLQGEGIKAERAFQDFYDYYKLHEVYFDRSTKLKIIATAEAISNAFRGKNKLESAYLQQLRQLMRV